MSSLTDRSSTMTKYLFAGSPSLAETSAAERPMNDDGGRSRARPASVAVVRLWASSGAPTTTRDGSLPLRSLLYANVWPRKKSIVWV